MAFIDYGYYVGKYVGMPVPADNFACYAERACDIIDGITSGRASKFAEKDGKNSTAAKKAACAQTEFLYSLGGSEYLGKTGKDVSREEIGNAAVSYRRDGGITYLGVPVSGLALMYLSEAGMILGGI